MTRLERFVFSLFEAVPLGTIEAALRAVDAPPPATRDANLVAYARSIREFLEEAAS